MKFTKQAFLEIKLIKHYRPKARCMTTSVLKLVQVREAAETESLYNRCRFRVAN